MWSRWNSDVTIKKRMPWSELGTLDDGGVVASTDADAAQELSRARIEGRDLPMIGLIGGDLCRTLSGPGDVARLRSPEARRYPMDLGHVEFDGEERIFVAHVIARRRWWRGRAVAVMNAQWFGAWDLGPKSHPNDGLLDISDGSLSLGDRIKARRRLATGTHVPHPGISTKRTATRSFTFDHPLTLWIDGIKVGSCRTMSVRVEPDAFTVVV